jgi:hypothetical protein
MAKTTVKKNGKKPQRATPPTTPSRHAAAPPHAPVTHSAHARAAPQRRLPAKSLERAATAFKNFSLSKFTDNSRPRNYVHPAQAKDPAATHALQRKLLSSQVQKLNTTPNPNDGTTIGITQDAVKALFPSYNDKLGTVQMADVLAVLKRQMTGTDFYTRGAPPLVQAAQQAQYQAQAQSIIQSIMNGGTPQ